jgi:hypothetical protein
MDGIVGKDTKNAIFQMDSDSGITLLDKIFFMFSGDFIG